MAIGLLESVTSLWSVCAKHASRVSRKHASRISRKLRTESLTGSNGEPRSPLAARSKQLLATISNKAIHFRRRKRSTGGGGGDFELDDDKEFGDGGLWQRTILMGDKCQPLDFSGVIYYDRNGKQLSEIPVRSPRASPLPSYLYSAEKRE